MQSAHVIGLSTLGIAVVVAAICVPLALGRVRRNPYYGFRFVRSMESDELWVAINRYGARRMLWWTAALAVLGTVLLLAPANLASPLLPLALWAPLVLLVPAVQAYRFAGRLPSRGDSPPPGTTRNGGR